MRASKIAEKASHGFFGTLLIDAGGGDARWWAVTRTTLSYAAKIDSIREMAFRMRTSAYDAAIVSIEQWPLVRVGGASEYTSPLSRFHLHIFFLISPRRFHAGAAAGASPTVSRDFISAGYSHDAHD